MAAINPDWQLKESSNAIRRFLTQAIDAYTIERLRVEFKFALKRLDELERKMNEQQTPLQR